MTIENRFTGSDGAIKNIDYPKEYHCVSLRRSLAVSDHAIVYTLSHAAVLEQEYETLTRELKGNYDLEKAMKLVTVEEDLFKDYCQLMPHLFSNITNPEDLTKQANEWIKHTDLLAKERTKSTPLQR